MLFIQLQRANRFWGTFDGQEGEEGQEGEIGSKKDRQKNTHGRDRAKEEVGSVKLQDYRDDFYTFSGKASDIGRQLAFAGIAIIWLFKKDTLPGLSIPRELLLPGIFILFSLSLDLFHYCLASIIWRLFYRSMEKGNTSEDAELQHSVWLERPLWLLFAAKIILVLLAYIWIIRYFLNVILLR
jgi:hypothetical protein